MIAGYDMTKKFSFKVFEQGADTLLAIADVSILGKTFEKDGLEIVINKDFYHEGFCSADEIVAKAGEATIINAMGKDVVELLVKNGIADSQGMLNPCGVPHVQVVKMM
jgi:hypothetical protein